MSEQALAVRPLHRDDAVHAAAVQPRGRGAEPAGRRASAAATTWRRRSRSARTACINSSTLNAVRFALQPHRHPPHEHRLLLRAGGRHQHLQLHAALHAVDRHRRLSARRRHGERVHVRHAVLADQRRPDARARQPPVRVRRERRAAGRRCRWRTCGRPASSRVDGTITGLGLADFLLGTTAATNGFVQAAPNTLDMEAEVPGTVRAGHLESRPAPDVELRSALGAVLPAAARERRRLPVRSWTGSSRHEEHGVPERAGRPVLPGRPGLPVARPACRPTGTTSDRASDWPGIRPATAGRRCAPPTARSYEFVNAQFHLNTSVAPPWGSEVRLNEPAGRPRQSVPRQPGRTDQHLPGHLRPERAVLAQRAVPQSLTNDLVSTNVHSFNVDRRAAVRRTAGSRRPATSAAARTTSGSPRRSTMRCSFRFRAPAPRRAPPTPTIVVRSTLIDPNNGRYYGPAGSVRERRQPELRRHAAVGARLDARLTTSTANYTLSNCYGSPDGNGGAHDQPGCRLQQARRSGLRRRQLHGRSSAQLLVDRAASSRRVSTTPRCAPRSRIGGWWAASAR